MWFPSCEIEEDNLRVSHGKQIRTKNKESFESKVLKHKQICVAVAVAVVVSETLSFGKKDNGQFLQDIILMVTRMIKLVDQE